MCVQCCLLACLVFNIAQTDILFSVPSCDLRGEVCFLLSNESKLIKHACFDCARNDFLIKSVTSSLFWNKFGVVRQGCNSRLHNGRDLWKCTHQCDETQGNNSAQAISTKTVFFGCFKKIGRQQKKKEAKKRTDIFTSPPSCLSSSFLPSSFVVYLLAPEEDHFCRNRLCIIVSLCFVALVSTFPEISSILSAQNSSCSLIPHTSIFLFFYYFYLWLDSLYGHSPHTTQRPFKQRSRPLSPQGQTTPKVGGQPDPRHVESELHPPQKAIKGERYAVWEGFAGGGGGVSERAREREPTNGAGGGGGGGGLRWKDDVPLMEFVYHVFIRMPGES